MSVSFLNLYNYINLVVCICSLTPVSKRTLPQTNLKRLRKHVFRQEPAICKFDKSFTPNHTLS